MATKKAVNKDIIRDKQFWITVGMFVVAVVLIVTTIFLVRETNRLSSITQSYSETLVDTAEDIQEVTASFSRVDSYLEDIAAHLETIDESIAETVDALSQVESTLEEVSDATVEVMSAIADLERDTAQVLGAFDYLTFYWCHYCNPCE